jgi:hypothetical protein
MSELQLIQPDPQPFKLPIRSLVSAYRAAYADRMKREVRMTWGHMIGRVKQKFETPDPETGELLIEYPPLDEWNEEIEGFFENTYAKERQFPFDLFLKQYGQYAAPKKMPKPKSQLIQLETCDVCLTDHLAGKPCPKCGGNE